MSEKTHIDQTGLPMPWRTGFCGLSSCLYLISVFWVYSHWLISAPREQWIQDTVGIRLFLIQAQTQMWWTVSSEDLQESEVCCSELTTLHVQLNDSWQVVLVFMFITRSWFYNRAKLENCNTQISETKEGNLKLPRTECYQHANCVASEPSVALVYLCDLGKWCHTFDPQGSHD